MWWLEGNLDVGILVGAFQVVSTDPLRSTLHHFLPSEGPGRLTFMICSILGCLARIGPQKVPARDQQVEREWGWNIYYPTTFMMGHALSIAGLFYSRPQLLSGNPFLQLWLFHGLINTPLLAPLGLGWWQTLAVANLEVLHHWFTLILSVLINFMCQFDLV